MTRKSIALLMLPLCLAGCGKYGALETAEGQALPPLAYGQKESENTNKAVGQSAEVLTAPSAQARPGRSDELLRRSERRDDDSFDLPPGAEPKPEPSEQTSPQASKAPSETSTKRR